MESIVERLRKLGLTEYQAKVYSSLLKNHLNSASRLSERSGVPRTKIYSVLESLAAKGWIKVYSGTPLLDELKTLLKGRDLKTILPVGSTATQELRELGGVAVANSRIYVEYDGEEANSGSVGFSDIIFNVGWVDDRILGISTMEYSKCVKRLRGAFEGAWRYAKK